ncbi:MAG: AbrB/MazE/SpoVT family DNA-binding domain-containing protein [Christensenellaceae bacterium]|jgi:AbrB family looped-hinge helix DNA binding protein|nr:AbrB/MazE/SpoVT family DNA-binding domain-containing protein [Christensenellaceae bacterium]
MLNATNMLVDNAKVMSKGQITLPKDFREALRIGTGDRVTLIYDGDKIILMNAMHYAMKMLQEGMNGAAEEAGIKNDDDVTNLVMNIRYGDNEKEKE